MQSFMEAISDVSDVIFAGTDRPLNINPILDTAASGLGATKAFLFLDQPDEGRMAVSASSGLNVSEFRRLDSLTDSPAFKRIFDSSQPDTIELDSDDPELGFL